MKSGTEQKELINKCLLLIEEKLEWGPSTEWHSEVFNELSEKIFLETSVQLSPTTLKRVWGKVKYHSAPSITTLNVLAKFAGFENWRGYKISHTGSNESKSIQQNSFVRGKTLVYASILTLIFISLFSMIDLNGDKRVNKEYQDVSFSSKPITEGLPNSVVFNLNLDGITSENIRIQQFWDPTKTINLVPGQSQATGIYYFPGYFRAKLIVDEQVVREHELFIKTRGWQGTIDYDPVPKYISNVSTDSGDLKFSESAKKEVSESENPLVTTYHLVDDFGTHSGDNFSLSAQLKHAWSDKWAVCQSTRIVILGTEGALIIPFSIPGCSSDLNVMLNDKGFIGKDVDLSALTANFTSFRDVELNVEDKEVVVLIDGEERFRESYTVSIGDIAGIRFRILGVGEVRNIKWSSETGVIALPDKIQ